MPRFLIVLTGILYFTTCEGQVISKSQTIGNFGKGNAEILKKGVDSGSTDVSRSTGQSGSIEDAHKIVIISKTAPVGVDINFLPLFGEYQKSEEQMIDDEIFLSECDKEFSSRKEAATFFNQIAWQYLREGDKPTAIYRFNLSYLLDSTNYDNFWGLGVIEFQEGNYSNAIDLMNRGLSHTDEKNYVFMTDLATIYIKQAIQRPNSVYETGRAKELLNKAIEIQPGYSLAYSQLTIINMLENKLDDAWNNFHKSAELNPLEVNAEILKELLSRKEDPKGIFKK